MSQDSRLQELYEEIRSLEFDHFEAEWGAEIVLDYENGVSPESEEEKLFLDVVLAMREGSEHLVTAA